ncbi:MAG: hypothetical protein GY701_25380 [Sulfitobacter sp.]|uniref:hypothetical protein n=1 Tax=Sphingomonas sp. TaxID=28214 RepID=UPI00259045E1|nr:hypothetical protein [Sphingomonas sp.]MCP3881692.1 hypothetical protein [Sulfitobacter sp.]MCP4025816.1 hypothetical protein [Sphingomonas sp.]
MDFLEYRNPHANGLPTVATKNEERADIADATERFLAAGGEIRVIPSGVVHDFDALPIMPETPRRRRPKVSDL